MNIDEYKQAVKDLFMSWKATPEQWEEMASAVLRVSEDTGTPAIDATIEPFRGLEE